MGWKIAIDCHRFHEATALPMMISERQPIESRWSPCVEKNQLIVITAFLNFKKMLV